MCIAPAPVGAESEAPSDDTRQFDSQEREKVSAPDFGPQTARATAEAARRYAEIAASGGWPRIAKPLGPDARGKPVLELRRRLAAEDFLAREDANEPVWDAKLEDAVKRFQSHVGLGADRNSLAPDLAGIERARGRPRASARGDGEAVVRK